MEPLSANFNFAFQWLGCILQKVAALELREQELREEVVQANQLRKQQLVELGLLREEEKQKMTREHETEVHLVEATFNASRPRWLSWLCIRLVTRRLQVWTPPGGQHSFVESWS